MLTGAAWFHVTGITPALGDKAAAATRRALQAAKAAGAPVSVDLNFRKKLWTEKQAQAVMRPLMRDVDVVIANEEDLQSVLGVHVPRHRRDRRTAERRRPTATRPSRWPTTSARRSSRSRCARASRPATTAGARCCGKARPATFHQSQRYDVRLVDRIGGGDSFAGGLDLRAGHRPVAGGRRCASRSPRAR